MSGREMGNKGEGAGPEEITCDHGNVGWLTDLTLSKEKLAQKFPGVSLI